MAAQEPDRSWLTLGDFPDGVPDVALVDVDLSGLWEVEVFGPSVAVVADGFYGPVSAVFTAVEDVFTSDVPQDDWFFFEYLFQLSYVIDRGAGFVDYLPTPGSLSPRGRKSLASQAARKVLHNSLGHTVEVSISYRSEVGKIWIPDGVEAVENCGDGVGVLIEHTVESSQYPSSCVWSDLDDPPALLSLSPDWIKLVFKDPIIFSFLLEKLEFQNKLLPPGRAARSWVALTSAIRASSANLPALACMQSAISTSPMVFSFSLHVEDCGGAIYLEFVFGVVKYLDPWLVSRESYWMRDMIIQVGKWPLWSFSFWNGLIEDGPSPPWGRDGPLARHF